jgi:hypothetical protein
MNLVALLERHAEPMSKIPQILRLAGFVQCHRHSRDGVDLMLHSQWNRPNEFPHIQWLREFRTQELNFILSQIAELLDDRILFLMINGPIGFSRIDHGDDKNLSLIVKRIGIEFVFSGELSLPAGNMWFWFPVSKLRLRLLRGLRLICSATSGAAFMRMPQQIFQAVEFYRSRTLPNRRTSGRPLWSCTGVSGRRLCFSAAPTLQNTVKDGTSQAATSTSTAAGFSVFLLSMPPRISIACIVFALLFLNQSMGCAGLLLSVDRTRVTLVLHNSLTNPVPC